MKIKSKEIETDQHDYGNRNINKQNRKFSYMVNIKNILDPPKSTN